MFLTRFCSILSSKIALRRPPGGLRRGPGSPGGRQEAPKWRQSRFRVIFGAILGSQNRSNLSWNLLKNEAPSWIDNFSLLEASGGGFGFDFGLVLGSILGSRAPYAIFAKISTAPQREHAFRGSGGVKKEPKIEPKTTPRGFQKA